MGHLNITTQIHTEDLKSQNKKLNVNLKKKNIRLKSVERNSI